MSIILKCFVEKPNTVILLVPKPKITTNAWLTYGALASPFMKSLLDELVRYPYTDPAVADYLSTAFEANDNEEFLTKETLEIYYQRTISGKFFGLQTISSEFADLIGLMVEVDVDLRLRSCARAEDHDFFGARKTRRPKLGIYFASIYAIPYVDYWNSQSCVVGCSVEGWPRRFRKAPQLFRFDRYLQL